MSSTVCSTCFQPFNLMIRFECNHVLCLHCFQLLPHSNMPVKCNSCNKVTQNFRYKFQTVISCDGCRQQKPVEEFWWCDDCYQTVCSLCAMHQHKRCDSSAWDDMRAWKYYAAATENRLAYLVKVEKTKVDEFLEIIRKHLYTEIETSAKKTREIISRDDDTVSTTFEIPEQKVRKNYRLAYPNTIHYAPFQSQNSDYDLQNQQNQSRSQNQTQNQYSSANGQLYGPSQQPHSSSQTTSYAGQSSSTQGQHGQYGTQGPHAPIGPHGPQGTRGYGPSQNSTYGAGTSEKVPYSNQSYGPSQGASSYGSQNQPYNSGQQPYTSQQQQPYGSYNDQTFQNYPPKELSADEEERLENLRLRTKHHLVKLLDGIRFGGKKLNFDLELVHFNPPECQAFNGRLQPLNIDLPVKK